MSPNGVWSPELVVLVLFIYLFIYVLNTVSNSYVVYFGSSMKYTHTPTHTHTNTFRLLGA